MTDERPLDPVRWSEVIRVFDQLADLSSNERAIQLEAIRARDPELRRQVGRLLASDIDAEARIAGRFANHAHHDPLGMAGRDIAHFSVRTVLAAGGMGVVYAALDNRLGRTVALKFPFGGQHLDASARRRFLQEARVAAALDHPNLCSIFEVGETETGLPFIAMSLYPGMTLATRLDRAGMLPLDVALKVGTQIARGLAAAHHGGIVHRDLKPGNVMLLPDGSVRILDFGLAKSHHHGLTEPGSRLGTAAYMAPEQVRGGIIDARTDLWALGVLLFEMLTARRPFPGSDPLAIAHAIVHETAPRASAARLDIPDAIDQLIATLLSNDPAARPASADEVAQVLSAMHSGAVAPVLPPQPGIRPGARRATMVGFALLGLVALAFFMMGNSAHAGVATPTLVVLNFDAIGDTTGVDYLTLGLSEDIRGDLGRLNGLIVPDFATSSKYGGDSLPPGQLADELRTNLVLRGTVDRSGDLTRLTVRLLDLGAARPVWSKSYDSPPASLPGVQREIVRQVANLLDVRLEKHERDLFARPATTSARAYELYLRGLTVELGAESRRMFSPTGTDHIRRPQSLYIQARDLDPAFALARARLALTHLAAVTYDTSAPRREQVRLESEAALRLSPQLSEAHSALAAYHERRGDLPQALASSAQAVAYAPNSVDSRLSHGSRLARIGRLEDGLKEHQEAMRLHPGSPIAALYTAFLARRLRSDSVAMLAFDRVLQLEPGYHEVSIIKGHGYLRATGIADTLVAVMGKIPQEWDPDGMATWARFTALAAERRFEEALVMLDHTRSALSSDGLVYHPTQLMRGRIEDWLGRTGVARINYRAARRDLEDSVAAYPLDGTIRVALGLANAGEGRNAAAIADARRAIALAPLETSTMLSMAVMGVAVEVFALAGEHDAALEMLELLFSMPAGREVTIPFLRVWPGFDPLRGDPRFATLIERFGAGGTALPGGSTVAP